MNLYRQTLKQAWELTIRNPLLWFFGLFAALAGNGEEYDTFFNNLRFVGDSQLNLSDFREAFLDGRIGDFFQNLSASFGDNTGAILGLLAVGLIILVLFAWLVTVSQAAIIRTASEREDGRSFGWLDAFATGSRCFWPLFALNILALAIIYVPLAILATPFIILYVSNASLTWAVLFTLLAFVVLVPINVVISFLTKYAAAFIVVRGSSLTKAINESWQLFKKHWLVTIELGLLLLIINVVYTVVLVSILTMFGLPFSRVGLIAFTAIIVIAGSIYAVFRYSAWTFLFRAMLDDRAVAKIVRLFRSKGVEE